jgi:hypothetical protein
MTIVTTTPELLARSVREHADRVALERHTGPGAARDPVTFRALGGRRGKSTSRGWRLAQRAAAR